MDGVDRDEGMLLDAAAMATKAAGEKLRQNFEQHDTRRRGRVPAAVFEEVLERLGVLRHHRKACARRFTTRGKADYNDFCRFAALSDNGALARCLADVAPGLRVRDAEDLLEPLLEADPRGSGVVPVNVFRDVVNRDWQAKTTELRLQQLASRFALPDDAQSIDYELLVRHLAAALATARVKAKRGRRTRFAPETTTRAKPPPRGQPLAGDEPWFARPAAPPSSYKASRRHDEDRDKTYFELSLSPARNRRASPRKARPQRDESDDDEALYAPPTRNRAPDALSAAVADRRVGLNSAGSPPTFCAPAPDDHLFAGAPPPTVRQRQSTGAAPRAWACSVCYYAGNALTDVECGICHAANPASARGRSELLGLHAASAGRVVRECVDDDAWRDEPSPPDADGKASPRGWRD